MRWITAGTKTPFYTRKTIEITKEIREAYADVCGLGQFVFYINGKKVSDHELDPGWTDYRKYIEYVHFDVTEYLKAGTNAIGAEIANGWYIMDDHHYTFRFPEFMPPNPNPYVPFGKSLVFAMKLLIRYTDDTEETILSDDSFKVSEHPVQYSNVYGSELYDARREKKGWNTPAYDDHDWKNAVMADDVPDAELCEQFQPYIKVIHTYEGKQIHGNVWDFGQNTSGMLEFGIQGKPGDTVYLYPAEKLDDQGNPDQMAKGWTLVDNVITYIIGSNEPEHYRGRFSYIAGRYIAVKTGSDAVITNMKLHAVTSAWKNSGTFTSDDDRYNQIYDMIKKTVEANMVSVHTDCPTIERFAWQEPNHLMAPSIMFMKDGRKLWEKFLKDMRAAQHTSKDIFHDYAGNVIPAGDGLVPSQAPCYIPNVLPVPGMGSFYDIIPWGSSVILGTYWHYMFYGDVKIIEDNFDAGMKYLNYLKTKMTDEGFICHGLGDWGNPENQLARENIETAFLYADAKTLAMFAGILGRTEETELKTFAEEIRNNYNGRLLQKKEDGHYAYRSYENKDAFITTQACEALPLYWGMVPEKHKDDIIEAFRETLISKGSFVSGEIGLPYIIQCAKRYGMNDLIASFITKETHPSYYAFIKDGMTTLGEYWETNPRSHCHDMMGHIIEWYYNGIAGIELLKPGFEEISIHPYMPEGMNHFTCTYETEYGTIQVEGNRKNGVPEYTWTVPERVRVKNQ